MRVDSQKAIRKRRRRVLALFASLLLALVAPSAARGAQETGSGQREDDARQQEGAARWRGERRARVDWLRRLNLTPEQVAQIGQIRRQAEAEGRPTARRLARARRALDEAIYAESADEALIEERAREVAAAQGELTRLRAATELRVRRVLTPEQLSLFRELRRQAQSRQALRHLRRREERRNRRPAQEAPDRP